MSAITCDSSRNPFWGVGSMVTRKSGASTSSADIAVRVSQAGAPIATFNPVCSLVVRNIGHIDFEHCLVEIIELSGTVPMGMPLPFPLRTDAQIRDRGRGRFILSPGQEAIIPVLFQRPQRANEWFFAGERRET
ncbi:MAG TPA: hypothetical protein VH678_11500 [Xanthobacteraceae bacterium]